MNDEIPVYKNRLNFSFLSDILYIRRQDIGDRRNDFSVSQILTHLDISVERKENAMKNFFHLIRHTICKVARCYTPPSLDRNRGRNGDRLLGAGSFEGTSNFLNGKSDL